MYSYDGLNNLLKAKGMKKSDLASKLGISSRTIAKIGKGEKLADHVIVRLCVFFGCEKEDIFTKVCDNKTNDDMWIMLVAKMLANSLRM